MGLVSLGGLKTHTGKDAGAGGVRALSCSGQTRSNLQETQTAEEETADQTRFRMEELIVVFSVFIFFHTRNLKGVCVLQTVMSISQVNYDVVQEQVPSFEGRTIRKQKLQQSMFTAVEGRYR